jgi:hypothetical protein
VVSCLLRGFDAAAALDAITLCEAYMMLSTATGAGEQDTASCAARWPGPLE